MIPQAADKLGGDDVAGVLRDQPNDEAAVSAEVVLDELVDAFVGRALDAIHGDEPVPDELHEVRLVNGGGKPHDEAAALRHADEDEPKPEEDEEDFVYEVHGKRALHLYIQYTRSRLSSLSYIIFEYGPANIFQTDPLNTCTTSFCDVQRVKYRHF